MEHSLIKRLFKNHIGELLHKFLSVSANITNDDVVRKSMLLSISVLSLLLFVAVYESVSAFFNGYVFNVSSAAGYSIFFFVYILNRQGKYRTAALLFIFTIPFVQFMEFLLYPAAFNFPNILFIGLDVVFCAVLFSVKLTVLVSLANIAGIILTPIWIMHTIPSFKFKQIIDPLFAHIGVSILLVLVIFYLQKSAEKQQEKLCLNEVRYRSIFENSPIALWELNASELKHNLDALKDNGIEDFNNYFDKHPDEFTACTSMVKIVDVNNTAVRMYEAESKEILKHNLDTVFSDERLAVFRNSIVRRMDGQFLNFDEIKQKTLTGKNLNVLIHSSLPEEFKDT